MNSKREFLKQSLTTMLALGASALTAKGFAQKQPLNKPAAVANVQVKPIVVSTWQHGLAANQEAWGILVKHGKAIDAVEAGVRIPEADPDVMTVTRIEKVM